LTDQLGAPLINANRADVHKLQVTGNLHYESGNDEWREGDGSIYAVGERPSEAQKNLTFKPKKKGGGQDGSTANFWSDDSGFD
jgi:hypothetical protein